jgi:catalase
MLQARLFSYPDTHRYRLGVNYQQIPINIPYNAKVFNYQRDGSMTVNGNHGGMPNYFPNSVEGTPQPELTFQMCPFLVQSDARRYNIPLTDVDFIQPGLLYRLMPSDQQARLIENLVGSLSQAKRDIQERELKHFKRADVEWGRRVEEGLLKSASKL